MTTVTRVTTMTKVTTMTTVTTIATQCVKPVTFSQVSVLPKPMLLSCHLGRPESRSKACLSCSSHFDPFYGQKVPKMAINAVFWLCGKCNYTTSNSDKSRSSKFKMKRHILRLHIEGGRATSQNQGVSKAWNQSQYSAPGSSGRQHSQVEYSSRGYHSTRKDEAQHQPEETVFINLKAEGRILDAELNREILKQQQQLMAQKAVEDISNPNFYYNYV